jgi:2-polyprenyl-3-methyl-5-hydroxy-6-metoxy-1,4-benzoquinol methylase
MKSFWNERYAVAEFVYGTAPNEYFKSVLDTLPAGKILLPCEGEGRNAVYAASQSWMVDAFDMSEAGKEKCHQLETAKGVSIDYQIADAVHFDYGEEKYDVIALIYAHFPPAIRAAVHQKCVQALKKGGIIIMEAFNPLQLNNTSGGPKDVSMLYTTAMLQEDFSTATIENIESLQVNLNEGAFHSGIGDVIRLIAKK